MQRELDRAFETPGKTEPVEVTQGSREQPLQSLRREIVELRRRLEAERAVGAPTSLEDWFEHKHQSQPHMTLKEIAARSGYSYGYVRRKHAQYLATKKK